MKIELKKIKHAQHLSRETAAFSAELHIDGKKVGDVHNDGGGGMNDIDCFDKANRAIIEKAEAFCKTLPPYEREGSEFKLKMNLDFKISLLVDDDLIKKDIEKYYKKLDKLAEKHFLVVKKKFLEDLAVGNLPKNGFTYRQYGGKVSPIHIPQGSTNAMLEDEVVYTSRKS